MFIGLMEMMTGTLVRETRNLSSRQIACYLGVITILIAFYSFRSVSSRTWYPL